MEKSEMLFAALIFVVLADIIFYYMKSKKLKQENSKLKDEISKYKGEIANHPLFSENERLKNELSMCKEDYASLTRTVVMSDVDKFSNEKTIRDLEQQLANGKI